MRSRNRWNAGCAPSQWYRAFRAWRTSLPVGRNKLLPIASIVYATSLSPAAPIAHVTGSGRRGRGKIGRCDFPLFTCTPHRGGLFILLVTFFDTLRCILQLTSLTPPAAP